MDTLSTCLICCGVVSDCFAIPWTVACQVPLSMRFPRQEYSSGLPFPSLRIFWMQGLNLCFPHWQAESLLLSHPSFIIYASENILGDYLNKQRLLITFDYNFKRIYYKIKVYRCFNIFLNAPYFSLIVNVCGFIKLEIGIKESIYCYSCFSKYTIPLVFFFSLSFSLLVHSFSSSLFLSSPLLLSASASVSLVV